MTESKKDAKVSYVTDASAATRLVRSDKNAPLHWDVTLEHEDGPGLKAHKVFLAAHSGFFRAKFSPEWVRSGESRVPLRRAEISYESLEAVLGSIYSQPFDIDRENVYDIHSAANFLEDLTRKCNEFLVKNLGTDNVLSTWRFSKRNFPGSNALFAASQSFIDVHFIEIYKEGGEFCGLEKSEIKEIISRESIGVSSEVEVLDAVLIWVNQDTPKRLQDGLGLFELVRWPLVDGVKTRELASAKAFVKSVVAKTEEEKQAKLSMMELLWCPQMHVSCANGEKVVPRCQGLTMRILEAPDRRRVSFTDFNLKTKAWGVTSKILVPDLSAQQDDKWQMKVLFFPSRVIMVTSNGLNLTGLRIRILHDGVITRTVKLALPEADLSSLDLFQVHLIKSLLCVPLYTVTAKKVLKFFIAYDLAKLEFQCSDEELMFTKLTDNMPTFAGSLTPDQSPMIVDPCTDDMYIIGGNNCNEVHIFNQNQQAWSQGPPTNMFCCNEYAYFFFVDSVLYSAGGMTHELSCAQNFEYLHVGAATKNDRKWIKGPNLIMPCRVRCHYVHASRLYLVGYLKNDDCCVQSIAMDEMSAGWRDDTSFFEGRKPWFVGIV